MKRFLIFCNKPLAHLSACTPPLNYYCFTLVKFEFIITWLCENHDVISFLKSEVFFVFQNRFPSLALGDIEGIENVAPVISGIGVAGSWLLGKYTSLTVSIAWDMVLISFVFSLLIGVIFGMMPANKAARLRPIHALRNE